MNSSATNGSIFGAQPLESKAEELAVLLQAGLNDEFSRQFQRLAKQLTDQEAEALIQHVNKLMSTGARKREVKVVVSQKSATDQKTVTVVDRSRFFGSGWSVARLTFAL